MCLPVEESRHCHCSIEWRGLLLRGHGGQHEHLCVCVLMHPIRQAGEWIMACHSVASPTLSRHNADQAHNVVYISIRCVCTYCTEPCFFFGGRIPRHDAFIVMGIVIALVVFVRSTTFAGGLPTCVVRKPPGRTIGHRRWLSWRRGATGSTAMVTTAWRAGQPYKGCSK